MPCLRTMCCVLAAVAALTGCSDSTNPGPNNENPLTGTRWVFDQWLADEGIQTFEAVDALEGEVVGYAFDPDGELTYRSFGWCATPPLTYFDLAGAWALDDDSTLELAYPDAVPGNPLRFEVVRQTREQLHLRPIPTADQDWHLNINGHFLWKLQDGELVLHQDMRTRAVAREFRLRRTGD